MCSTSLRCGFQRVISPSSWHDALDQASCRHSDDRDRGHLRHVESGNGAKCATYPLHRWILCRSRRSIREIPRSRVHLLGTFRRCPLGLCMVFSVPQRLATSRISCHPVVCSSSDDPEAGSSPVARFARWAPRSVRSNVCGSSRRHEGGGSDRVLLETLEVAARGLGYDVVRLDTNEVLVEAIRLYEACGYRRIGRYNDNPDPTHFYEKVLTAVPREAST